MTHTLKLISAKHATQLAQSGALSYKDIVELKLYATNKIKFLQSRNKNMRAKLWINALSAMQEAKPTVTKTTREGLKPIKIGGVKQWLPKDMTINGINMLRKTANAHSKISIDYVKKQERAYRKWREHKLESKHSFS